MSTIFIVLAHLGTSHLLPAGGGRGDIFGDVLGGGGENKMS